MKMEIVLAVLIPPRCVMNVCFLQLNRSVWPVALLWDYTYLISESSKFTLVPC